METKNTHQAASPDAFRVHFQRGLAKQFPVQPKSRRRRHWSKLWRTVLRITAIFLSAIPLGICTFIASTYWAHPTVLATAAICGIAIFWDMTELVTSNLLRRPLSPLYKAFGDPFNAACLLGLVVSSIVQSRNFSDWSDYWEPVRVYTVVLFSLIPIRLLLTLLSLKHYHVLYPGVAVDPSPHYGIRPAPFPTPVLPTPVLPVYQTPQPQMYHPFHFYQPHHQAYQLHPQRFIPPQVLFDPQAQAQTAHEPRHRAHAPVPQQFLASPKTPAPTAAERRVWEGFPRSRMRARDLAAAAPLAPPIPPRSERRAAEAQRPKTVHGGCCGQTRGVGTAL